MHLRIFTPSNSALVVLLSCIIATTVVAAGPDDTPDDQAREEEDSGIVQQLKSGDPTIVQAAVQQFRKTDRKSLSWVRQNMEACVPALLVLDQHALVEEAATRAIIDAPTVTIGVGSMLRCQIEVAAARNDRKRALSLAKCYFNYCRMAETQRAIDIVCRFLSEADARQFRRQQIEGFLWSKLPGAVEMQRDRAPQDMLRNIPIDAAPYESAIAKRRESKSHGAFTSLANLCLLVNRPAEAEEAFRRALAMAADAQVKTDSEGVARAIRARDGVVGRANAYLLGYGSERVDGK
jgi:hypothetical protein